VEGKYSPEVYATATRDLLRVAILCRDVTVPYKCLNQRRPAQDTIELLSARDHQTMWHVTVECLTVTSTRKKSPTY